MTLKNVKLGQKPSIKILEHLNQSVTKDKDKPMINKKYPGVTKTEKDKSHYIIKISFFTLQKNILLKRELLKWRNMGETEEVCNTLNLGEINLAYC